MIRQSLIKAYKDRATVLRSELIVNEAKRSGKQTAFLSHSHKDAELAKSLQGFLHAQGWEVYIDWEDLTMPAIPDKRTAKKIQKRIKELEWFLYLATANSADSRWCPWEIGYADGSKATEKIIIVPTRDNFGNDHGNEYLELYRHVFPTKGGKFALFEPKVDQGVLLESIR